MDHSSMESFLNKITSKKSILKTIVQLHHINMFLDKKVNYITYSISKDIDLSTLEIYLSAKDFPSDTLKKIKKIKPVVQGRDLLKIGMQRSKEFKNILQMVYELQINRLFEK